MRCAKSSRERPLRRRNCSYTDARLRSEVIVKRSKEAGLFVEPAAATAVAQKKHVT